MALPTAEDLELIKKLIEEIRISGGDIPSGLEIVNIKTAEDATKAIRILGSASRDVDKTFSSINARLQNIVAEITKSHNPINIATSSYRKLESQLRKIQNDEEGIIDLNKKELTQIKQKVTSEQEVIRRQGERLKTEKLGNNSLTETSIKRLQDTNKITDAEASLLRGYLNQNEVFKEINDTIDKRIIKEGEYTEILGIAGNSAAALKGFLSTMGLGKLNEFLQMDEAMESAKEQAKGLSSVLEQNKDIQEKAVRVSNLQSISDSLSSDKLKQNNEIQKESIELDKLKIKNGQELLNRAQLRAGVGGIELQKKQKALDKIKRKHLDIGKELTANKKKLKGENSELGNMKSTRDALGKSLGVNGEQLTKMGAKTKVLKSLGAGLFKNLAKKLHDPMTYITAIITAVKKLDDLTGKMAKNMNMSMGDSRRMARHLQTSADLTFSTFVTGRGLAETNMELNSSLGMQVEMNHENLATLTKIGKIAGYTSEQKQEINKLGAVSGQQADDFLKSGLGTIKAMTSQKGLALNTKQLFQDMLKASNSIKASLGGNADKLAAAVVEAKALGTTLQVVEGIVSSLIDIEGSFKKELEAELLIGRDLNLERARALALAGEYGEVAKEINREVGNLAEFEKLNVIQQQKLAEAVGMTRDQLSGALIEQEAMEKLSGVEGKNAKEKFDNLVKQVGMEEAKKRLGNDQLADQMAQANLQERMAAAMEKLSEVFLSIADALTPIFSMLMTIGEVVIPIINLALLPIKLIFQGIAEAIQLATDLLTGQAEGPLAVILGIMSAIALTVLAINAAKRISIALGIREKIVALGGLGPALGKASAYIFESLAKIPFGLGIPIAIAAVLGMISMVMGLTSKKGNDIMSPGTGGAGYGSRTLFGPEGAIALNNKDTVIAGTDLFQKGNDVVSLPQDPGDMVQPKQENTPTPQPPVAQPQQQPLPPQKVEVSIDANVSDPYQMGFALDKTESVIA